MLAEFAIQLLTLFLSPEDQRLAEVIQKRAPRYLTRGSALLHVMAAKSAETEIFSKELLLSMAYSESRYNPKSVSRLEDGVRVANVPRWDTPPKNVTGPYFCGVTQVMAKMSWRRCVRFRNIFLAYQTAARELEWWFNEPNCRRSKERMRCALFGYGGGYPAIQAKTLTYPTRVLRRAMSFERAVAGNS